MRISQPVGGDHDQVLDPDPEPPGQVDARLDGDHIARRSSSSTFCESRGRLVDVEPDSVPETVAEMLAVAAASITARAAASTSRPSAPSLTALSPVSCASSTSS